MTDLVVLVIFCMVLSDFPRFSELYSLFFFKFLFFFLLKIHMKFAIVSSEIGSLPSENSLLVSTFITFSVGVFLVEVFPNMLSVVSSTVSTRFSNSVTFI